MSKTKQRRGRWSGKQRRRLGVIRAPVRYGATDDDLDLKSSSLDGTRALSEADVRQLERDDDDPDVPPALRAWRGPYRRRG
jgi:hypothetical protein